MWSQRRASFPHTSSRPGIDFSYFFQIKNQNIFKHENCRMYLVSSRLVSSSLLFLGKRIIIIIIIIIIRKATETPRNWWATQRCAFLVNDSTDRPSERLWRVESWLHTCDLQLKNPAMWCDAWRAEKGRKGERKDERRSSSSSQSVIRLVRVILWNVKRFVVGDVFGDAQRRPYVQLWARERSRTCIHSRCRRPGPVGMPSEEGAITHACASVGCDCQVTRDVFSSHLLFVFRLCGTIFKKK